MIGQSPITFGEDFRIFTIYSHLGHVTWSIYTNNASPLQLRLQIIVSALFEYD